MKILTKTIGVSVTLSREYNSYKMTEEVQVEYQPGEEPQLEQMKQEMKQRVLAEVKHEIDAISGLMKQPFNPNPPPYTIIPGIVQTPVKHQDGQQVQLPLEPHPKDRTGGFQ
jgi:hypothetical protein